MRQSDQFQIPNSQFSSEAEAEMRLRAFRIEAVTMRESLG